MFPVAKDEDEPGAGGKWEELMRKGKGKGTKRGKYNLEWVKKGCRTGETVKNENLNNGERRRKRGKGNETEQGKGRKEGRWTGEKLRKG